LKERRKSGNTLRKVKEFGKITYDFWSGVKYIVVLSAILWWIPLFGPILAGYVGGRRTGGPKKGILASIVALGIIGTIYYLFTHGYVYFALDSVIEYPDKILAMATSSTFFGPYLEFIEQYWTTFFHRIWAGVPFESNSYILTIIFAYIGGIISYEKRREFTDGLRSLGSVEKEISSIHRYAKNPARNKNTASAHRGGDSLQEMRPVRYSGRKENSGSIPRVVDERDNKDNEKSPRDKKTRRDEVLNLKNKAEDLLGDQQSSSKSNVRHHSRNNGDDWEFL